MLDSIVTHPMDKGDLGTLATAGFASALTELRPLQTTDRGAFGIAPTAGRSGAQTQLLLCRWCQTKDKGDLGI
ncbi:hypothetical protein ABBQ38_002285 [Trebouxia sp. C0009 RCD-2024]